MKDIKKREQTLFKIINTNKLMFEFSWKEKKGRLFILLRIIMALINAIFSVVYAVMPGLIINELINYRNLNTLIEYVGILTLTPIISHYINKCVNLYLLKLRNETELKLLTDFFEFSLDMDYETLEKPDIQILKRRAGYALENVFGFIEIMAGFLSSLFSIFAMSSIIITLNPFIILLVICIVCVNSIVAKKINYKKYIYSKENDKYDNYRDVLSYMMNYIGYAKENRLFGLKEFFIKKYYDNQVEMNQISYKSHKCSSKSSTCNTITSAIQQSILYLYLIYNVLVNGLPIGNLTIYMSAVEQLSNALNSIFASYLDLSRNSLDIQDYLEFTSIPSQQRKKDGLMPSFNDNSIIEFRNVSFKYPGSERYALKNINLKIHGNEKLCIVGENGSGKSTFIKLLTRLYFPTEGEILLNGININEYDYEKYQQLFSPVFQNYCIFSFSIGENIMLSLDKDQGRLDEVCDASKLTELINKLPKRYETQVGKSIDPEGMETSGGEGQKIAIARALYHNAPIFLLDEPTASLDPVAEYDIYKHLHDKITNKVAIMITHRLSAVQLADKVAVFNDGSVIEYGTHNDLYAQKGIYTKMFDTQANFYRESVNN